jgi:hypothetical protein
MIDVVVALIALAAAVTVFLLLNETTEDYKRKPFTELQSQP